MWIQDALHGLDYSFILHNNYVYYKYSNNIGIDSIRCTPQNFKMEAKNDGFQKESTLPGCYFQVPCQTLRV